MKTTARFDARAVRDALLKRGGPDEAGFVRYVYRPFDIRWLYWEADSSLLDRPRPDYRPHVFEENLWLEARERAAKEDFSRGALVRHLADNFGNGLSSFFPGLVEGRRYRKRWQQRAPSQPVGCGIWLSQTARRRRGGPVSPCPCHTPRSRLPRGQCWGAQDGLAAYPAPWLVRWGRFRGS